MVSMNDDTVRSGADSTLKSSGHVLAAILVAASLVVPGEALAQQPGAAETPPPAPTVTRQGPDGFLFVTPRVALGMRAGFNFARAGSDVFDLATNQLTLNHADFGSFMVAGDLAITVAGPIDIVLGGGYASMTKSSEFREYEDQDGLPITQRTSFSQAPVTGLVRAYLTSRGRQIGRFAWVPSKFAPYVGFGGGWTHYTFRQSGSFVDYVDLSIFDDTFESSGWTAVGIANAGADYTLHPHVVLNTDVRYQFGSGDLDREFIDFSDGLDLTGFQLSMGVRFRF